MNDIHQSTSAIKDIKNKMDVFPYPMWTSMEPPRRVQHSMRKPKRCMSNEWEGRTANLRIEIDICIVERLICDGVIVNIIGSTAYSSSAEQPITPFVAIST